MEDERNPRGWLNRTLERIEDLPVNAVGRGHPITDSARRRIYENGLVGHATILKAPGKPWVSDVAESHGRFTVRVELPGRDPYKAKVWQSFGKSDWEQLRRGAVVECRVDSGNPGLVLLCAPEAGGPRVSVVVDSGQILAGGLRAQATVLVSAAIGQKAPGTDDPAYLLNLELRSEDEPDAWKVQIAQRVPEGAAEMVAPGRELVAAYMEIDGGESVAIDWPASSDGRFA